MCQHVLGDLSRRDQVLGAGLQRATQASVGAGGDGLSLRLTKPARDEPPRDLVRRQLPEPELRAARPDRREQHVGPRGDQHEHGRRGRLLERLQQCVLRLRHQRVSFVDYDDAPAALEGAIARPLDRLADLFDFDRSVVAGLEHQGIRVDAARDPRAGRADAAGIYSGCRTLGAWVLGCWGAWVLLGPAAQIHEEQLSACARRGGHALADAGGSGQARRQRLVSNRSRKETHDADGR